MMNLKITVLSEKSQGKDVYNVEVYLCKILESANESVMTKSRSVALTGAARLGIVPQSEKSPARFPVRAHAWVAVWSLVRAHMRGNWLMFL